MKGVYCAGNQCKYVHGDQVEVYAHVIARLKYHNKEAKSAAEAAARETGDAMGE